MIKNDFLKKFISFYLMIIIVLTCNFVAPQNTIADSFPEQRSNNVFLKALTEHGFNKEQKLILNEHGADIVNDELILFVNNTEFDMLESDLKALQLDYVKIISEDSMVLAKKKADVSWEYINNQACGMDNIVAMMPNYKRVVLDNVETKSVKSTASKMGMANINDPLLDSQWYLDGENGVNIFDAWKSSMGSPAIKVAVIDSGIALNSKEFEGKKIKQYDVVGEDDNVNDSSVFSHGSHVSGIIAANVNNNFGIAGIAPDVSLIEIDCFYYDKKLGTEVADDAHIFRSLEICIEQNVRIANMSFGAFADEIGPMERVVYETKMEDMRNSGIIPVCAAGNENSSRFCLPSDLDSTVGVIALNEKSELAGFSNYGLNKDIAAPGVRIVSVANDKFFQLSDGTSMAAPIVTGVLALMASRAPYVSNDELLEILYSTAVDLGAAGKDRNFANGRVDASAAMAELNKRYPVELISSNDDNFVLNRENSKKFGVRVHSGTKCSVKIYNVLTGELVKEVCELSEYEPGDYSLAWDGKDESGNYVKNGKYRMNIDVYVDNDTQINPNHSISQLFNVTDVDYAQLLPMADIKLEKSICELSSYDKLKFSVKIPKSSICDVEIRNGNDDVVASLASGLFVSGSEEKKFTWNLFSKEKKLVNSGIYYVYVCVKNDYAAKVFKSNFSVISVPKPKIKKFEISPKKIKENKIKKTKLKVKFKLNTTAYVYIRVLNRKKNEIEGKNCAVINSGNHKYKLKLKRNKKWLKPGKYYVDIVAYNYSGETYSRNIEFNILKSKKKRKNKKL